MFYIIETETQLNKLTHYSDKSMYVDIIPSNYQYHPRLNDPVSMYVRPSDTDHGFIINFSHYDCFKVSPKLVYEFLSKYDSLWCLNKKEFLHHFPLKNLNDIGLVESLVYYNKIDKNSNVSTLDFYYRRYSSESVINQYIPISKLFEHCEQVYDKVKTKIVEEKRDFYDFYNDTATRVFNKIEANGLKIAYKEFVDKFKPKDPFLSIRDNVVYTKYNLNNITSRPTNAFNSVNFAALPKSDGSRKVFLPKNDLFVEFDFDGYHVRLLSEQIGYALTEESAHIQIAKLIFGKDKISDEEYSAAKQINFQALYGKIPEEHKDLDFFVRVKDYISKLWSQYEKKGYIEDPISKKRLTKRLNDMHPAKLMNYLMQSLETSRNIIILDKVIDYLKDKNTTVALYVYDAIIFDFSKVDGKEVLEDISKIISENNKYPVKFKYNNNLLFTD